MEKLTKEQLAAKLDGRNYYDEISSEECKVAYNNGLVVVLGYSDDTVFFHGAICDETDAYNGGVIELTQAGIFQSECREDTICPYFEQLRRVQKTHTLKAFWCGTLKREKTSRKWEKLGKPTWMFELAGIPVAEFSIYDTREGNEHFCRGIVFDLKDLNPPVLETDQ